MAPSCLAALMALCAQCRAQDDIIAMDSEDQDGIRIQGLWNESSYQYGYRGSSYFLYMAGSLANTRQDRWDVSVTFTPTILRSRTYHVYFVAPHFSEYARSVVVTVVHAGGVSSMTLDVEHRSGKEVLVGTYTFDPGTTGSVSIGLSDLKLATCVDSVVFRATKLPETHSSTLKDAVSVFNVFHSSGPALSSSDSTHATTGTSQSHTGGNGMSLKNGTYRAQFGNGNPWHSFSGSGAQFYLYEPSPRCLHAGTWLRCERWVSTCAVHLTTRFGLSLRLNDVLQAVVIETHANLSVSMSQLSLTELCGLTSEAARKQSPCIDLAVRSGFFRLFLQASKLEGKVNRVGLPGYRTCNHTVPVPSAPFPPLIRDLEGDTDGTWKDTDTRPQHRLCVRMGRFHSCHPSDMGVMQNGCAVKCLNSSSPPAPQPQSKKGSSSSSLPPSTWRSGMLLLLVCALVLATAYAILALLSRRYCHRRGGNTKATIEQEQELTEQVLEAHQISASSRAESPWSIQGVVSLFPVTSKFIAPAATDAPAPPITFSSTDQLETQPEQQEGQEDPINEEAWAELQLTGITLKELLDTGGHANVYRGSWEGTEVAIKLSRAPLNRAMLQEALTLSKLRHPALCTFYGTCECNGVPGIVMELLRGGSLHWFLHQRPAGSFIGSYTGAVPHWLLCRIGLEVATGLAYLHKHRLIHRDVKTANVLLDLEGHAKVADLGICTAFANDDTMHTPGVGTIRYTAPEVMGINISTGGDEDGDGDVEGDGDTARNPYGHKADIFSYGLLLWETMHQRVPFSNLNPIQVAFQIKLGKRPPMELDPELQDYAPIIEACWRPAPEDRPSMEEVVNMASTVCAQLFGPV